MSDQYLVEYDRILESKDLSSLYIVWEDIEMNGTVLCRTFMTSSQTYPCIKCPVYKATGQQYCDGSPWCDMAIGIENLLKFNTGTLSEVRELTKVARDFVSAFNFCD